MSTNKTNQENKLIKEIIEKIKTTGLKTFPDDFLYNANCTEEIIPNKILIITAEFFGQSEIKTSDGEFFKMVDDINLAKYYVYSSSQRKSILKIPVDKLTLIKAIEAYEKYFDSLVKMIDSEINNSGFNVNKMKITNDIIHSLNLTRF